MEEIALVLNNNRKVANEKKKTGRGLLDTRYRFVPSCAIALRAMPIAGTVGRTPLARSSPHTCAQTPPRKERNIDPVTHARGTRKDPHTRTHNGSAHVSTYVESFYEPVCESHYGGAHVSTHVVADRSVAGSSSPPNKKPNVLKRVAEIERVS